MMEQGDQMTFDDRNTERNEARRARVEKRQRSRADMMQGRLIPESPEIDIGV